MPTAVRFLIGLVLALAAAWIAHGPLGGGDALIGRLESQARSTVAATGLPRIDVRLDRSPLARNATLSGPANDFQRQGMGSETGLTDRVAEIEGVAAVRWADEPGRGGGAMPLLAETLILAALFYVVGFGLAWFLWGRRRHDGFA